MRLAIANFPPTVFAKPGSGILPGCENVIFLESIGKMKCSGWQSKYMTTKWGPCNTSTGKIWLNLQLAKKPIECLEYVILHELVHLKIRNHGTEFVAEMNRYMQNWREIRNQLNESKLDYLAPMD